MVIKLIKRAEYNMFSLSGEMTRMNCALFLRKMEPFVERDPYIVFDMGGVEFVDSGGLSALVLISKRMRQRHAKMLLYRVQPDVLRSIRTMGLTPILSIASNMDEVTHVTRPLMAMCR